MNQHEHIINLIAKQLRGLATPQEAEELQHCLQTDASCQQVYNDMAVIWQKTDPLLADPSFNTDKAWLKLDDRITQLTPRPKLPFHTIISTLFLQRAAAAVLVLAVVVIGGYWFSRQGKWQTFTATNQNETLTLPDQSVVLVRKGSSIKYLKTFDKKERQVELTGEAFFKVQHKDDQPFLVTTGNAEVKVLGTTFLVNSTQTTDEVVVVTGKVNVTDKKASNNQVVLTKGQRAVLRQDHFYQSPVTDSNFIAWKTGQLIFNNTTLPIVLQDLSHFYGVELELAPGLKNIAEEVHVTVEFNNQPIEQALDELKLITGLQIKKEKDKVIFYRN
jgi:transmembrane sensor